MREADANVSSHVPLLSAQPHLNALIAYADEKGSCSVIEQSRIVAHAVYRARPRGTFAINCPILILVNTDRGRFDYSTTLI
jgi:hypothetical protein